MRTLGIVYVIAYLVDLSVSIIATISPRWGGLSNGISSLLIVATIAVMALACLNKLKPRPYFLLAAGYYLFMVGVGFMLGIAIVLKLGAQEVARQASERSLVEVLHQQFAWYVYLHWGLLTVWTLVGLYGLRAAFSPLGTTGPGAAPNGGPATPPPIPEVAGRPPSVN